MSCYSFPGGRKPRRHQDFAWMVLVGNDARVAGMVFGPTRPPVEKVVQLLELPPDLPVLVGTP